MKPTERYLKGRQARPHARHILDLASRHVTLEQEEDRDRDQLRAKLMELTGKAPGHTLLKDAERDREQQQVILAIADHALAILDALSVFEAPTEEV